jgi:3-mercaptopyruvate sulfurtransferase SseA
MRLLTYSITALALAFLLTACGLIHSKTSQNANAPTATATPYADGARRVTISELETMIKDGSAVVIDVRDEEAYNAGHIPGAKLIPSAEILNHIKELPRDKLIVTYCS